MDTDYEALTTSKEYLDWDTRAVVKVSLLWLINAVTDSCDGYDLSSFEGWREMFAHKCSDTGFGHLVDSMMERGFMPEGCIGFNQGQITEGHHRLCAAILLGLDDVYVSRSGGNVRQPKKFPGDWPMNLVDAHDHEYDGVEPYPLPVYL